MSREIKLGIFALVVILGTIWGYTYLKGRNLLSNSYTFSAAYSDVTALTTSSPVFINGLRVGSIIKIDINPDNLKEMVVTFDIRKDYRIPTDAVAALVNESFVGGKAISLKFDKLCTGDNCAKSGHRFVGKNVGLLGSLVGTDDVRKYASAIGDELNVIVKDLGSEKGEGAVNDIVSDLQKTMENLAEITETTSGLMQSSYRNLNKTVANMATITENLAASNGKITSMIANLDDVTRQVKDGNLGNTISTTNETMSEAKLALENLQTTLNSTSTTMTNLNEVVNKINSGDGSLSQLLNDKQLYDNLEMTSKNLSLLLQDFRLNPSRYVKVSVFGRKNNDPYVSPEEDPAFQEKN